MAPKIPSYIKSKESYFKSEKGSIFLVILFGIGITVLGLEILKTEYGGMKHVLRSYAREGVGFFFDLSDRAASEKVTRQHPVVQKRTLDKKTLVEIGPGALAAPSASSEVKRGRLRDPSLAEKNSLSNYWESLKESLSEKREPRNYNSQDTRSSWVDNFKKRRQQTVIEKTSNEKAISEFDQNERSNLGRLIEGF